MSRAGGWAYDLGDRIALIESDEEGVVIARAEYDNANDQYLVRYVNGTGCQVEQWWAADALDAVEAD